MSLDPKIPGGPLSEKWDRHRFDSKLINPANRRKYTILVVGTGLAGASAASSLGELGYNVISFCIHDSPRRAHSIAAQGGINAAKNYQNDGDSIQRLFYDTVKGGDYRSREANVYRLAQTSVSIIDQCVAQGVPFAREYGGLLDNRSFGGAQVSRTFYARGQTGQQLLLGAYQSMMRQVERGTVTSLPNREMLDLVLVNGQARGIVCRNLITGALERYTGHAVLLCTGGYGTAYYLSTNAVGSNVTASWRAHKRGAYFANPCYTQIHPTCIPVSGTHQSKLTLMSESLRNDGRVWVPKNPGDARPPGQIPDGERDYYLERRYPSFGNLVPRDVASRNAKAVCDEGRGVGESGLAVYLDFGDAIKRLGPDVIRTRYGNLFDMYTKITDEDPYSVPMRIYPAIHYTMGGLWVDYNLMSTIPGLHVLGEANFSDHGANRLGASALMQGLADGYFVIPYTLAHYLGSTALAAVSTDHEAFREAEAAVQARIDTLLSVKGSKTPRQLHRELGQLLWDEVGMARSDAGLRRALDRIPRLREEFWQNVSVPGPQNNLNKNLEYAGRVGDYLEFAEVLTLDALNRTESCGGHFREESQTPDGEALRDDEHFAYAAAWEFQGVGKAPVLHKEPLVFEYVKPSQRSYKEAYADSSESVASGGPGRPGTAGRLHGRAGQPGHVVPRDAGRPERRADCPGRRSRRLRVGLPGGHLRNVRLPGGRRPPRAGPRHHRVPAPHAALPGQRPPDHRAVARPRLSAHQGPGRRSERVRPDHPGGRLHVGQRRRRAGRQRHPHRQEHRGTGDGCGRLHRLRRVRRRLQERLGGAVHVGEGQPPGAAAPRRRRAADAGDCDGAPS
jgi:succinate dehydrogenase / fumarate reductase flavoprotein subunit